MKPAEKPIAERRAHDESNAEIKDGRGLLRLRQENARLKSILAAHSISWEETSLKGTPSPALEKPFMPELSSYPAVTDASEALHTGHPESSRTFSTEEKIDIFRRLFRGREDIFASRWESSSGRSGYSPACANEWATGICGKPDQKCPGCGNRKWIPLDNQALYGHLSGKHTIGIYPLETDDTCHFLAVDLDEEDWRDDAQSFLETCRETGIPASLEISRSGNGAHIWIFFSDITPASEARKLGAALISRTCDKKRQMKLTSYDRLFPNQDTMPKGGFGNLIALPLQKKPREQGFSVFVDDEFKPWPDQWAYLASIDSIFPAALNTLIARVIGNTHPLDVAFVEEEDEVDPWERKPARNGKLTGPMPESLELVISDRIYIAKEDVPNSLSNRIIRLAAFQNPDFYRAQALRLSVWNTPRIIGCAENFPRHIAIPRGCLEIALELLGKNGIRPSIRDERVVGHTIDVSFTGALRGDQETALKAIQGYDTGVLCAPTAFGKTVVAAALIARRKVSTLILVNRTDLLRQWQERLLTFLQLPDCVPGQIGGGKNRPSGIVDIAVIQALARRENVKEILDAYGQIIVDECHHISAVSFETVLKQARARFVAGLTATPIRRDGHHPIIFMQCGPIRHTIRRQEQSAVVMEVLATVLPAPSIQADSAIHDVFNTLSNDPVRNRRICSDIIRASKEGRKILVLSERTGHIEILRDMIGDVTQNIFVLHGRLSPKCRSETVARLDAMPEADSRILFATGKLIGEGFDHPVLDTLVLAMPISWRGTLQQYAGRLHREHVCKKDIRVIDYVDGDNPVLRRMWEKRRKGYQAMGYAISIQNSDDSPELPYA